MSKGWGTWLCPGEASGLWGKLQPFLGSLHQREVVKQSLVNPSLREGAAVGTALMGIKGPAGLSGQAAGRAMFGAEGGQLSWPRREQPGEGYGGSKSEEPACPRAP